MPIVEDADAADDVVAEPAAPPRTGPSRTAFLLAVVVAAVFFVTTVLFAVLAVSERDDGDSGGDRQAVSDVAARFMDALLRFDYRDPESNRQAVLALSAAQFRSQFEDAFEENAALYAEFEAVATPTIEAVYVEEITDDQAAAIVEYDRVIETADRTNTEDGFYAELQLARIDGEWLVTNVFNINFALGAGPGAGPASTTTTSTP